MMTAATQPRAIEIVAQCQSLFEDLDFNAVKQWKAAGPGRKAIGYMPVYVPREIGLVHTVADDPVAAAIAWFDAHLAGKSGASVRYALRAARLGRIEAIRAGLAEVEKLYLQGLMNTRDANEGLAAFLARRPPVWEHQ